MADTRPSPSRTSATGQIQVAEFSAAVNDWPEVIECYSMTGETDYLLRVQVEDLDHFSRFLMGKLVKQPGVIDVKSSFALTSVKRITALPLASG
jgi:Lrp/AsnC family leucine-responsive transcriptional regulator